MAILCYYQFTANVGYAIVLPSLFLYLTSMNQPHQFFFGLCVSAFAISMFVATPIAGWFVDARTLRQGMIASILLLLAGNLLYAMAPTADYVLMSRFVSGLGGSMLTISKTYVIRGTSTERRASQLTLVQAIGYTGLLVGPMLNLLFARLPKEGLVLYQWPQALGGRIERLTPYTAPGYFLAILSLLSVLLTGLLAEPNRGKEQLEDVSDSDDGGEEDTDGLPAANGLTPPTLSLWTSFVLIMKSQACVVLLFMQFVIMLNQFMLETLVTPLSKAWFNWGAVENGFYFGGLTIVIVIGLFGASILQGRGPNAPSERTLLLAGHLVTGCSIFWFTLRWQRLLDGKPRPPPVWEFLAPSAVLAIGMPLTWSSLDPLFSKLVPTRRIQGFGQGLFNSAASLAAISGPLISGVTLSYQPTMLMPLLVGCWIILSFLFGWQWKGLLPKKRQLKLNTLDE